VLTYWLFDHHDTNTSQDQTAHMLYRKHFPPLRKLDHWWSHQ